MLRHARKHRTTRGFHRTAGGIRRKSTLLGAAALGAALALTPVCAQAATSAPHHYVALGDSYAAGAGVPGQSAGLCLRSDHNYGHLVASALRAGAYTDVTCSAAKVSAMTQAQYPDLPSGNAPQLDAVTADTDLVTIGIGGNDLGVGPLGIAEVIAACVGGAVANPLGTPCRDIYHHGHWEWSGWSGWSWQYGSDDLLDRIDGAAPRLADVLNRVHAKAPGARVLVVGYPSVLPADGSTCVLEQPITPGDVEYLHGILGRLNAMLRSTAAANGAGYVDTATPSARHDICSDDRWIEGALPGSPSVPFHPNATGEKAMADAVLAALR
ncbi:SGNH/GDSL hydrolase family protein [Kitasatospora sp. NPDC049258]|uniref:SGNH/GDSL hydrolase family protein n=1 Tax=Kitasatospora sp. NPDC049258 TaxID=3155394 RepID=UPI00341D3F39